ncbi:MAG: M28 family peptidase, partial [Gammaproteobacteria bacterium]|nr:M28 family peptidase [Gammaproteobacteria bacterium]
EVAGQVVLVRTTNQIEDLEATDLQDKVVFLDFALLDRQTSPAGQDVRVVTRLFDQGIAGLVLVAQFSENPEESHGGYIGDGIPLEKVAANAAPPVLYIRLEDLAAAGIANWQDLARVEVARLVWDSDVFSPGASGNLVARIPGADSSRAVILGAHIDSTNSPGAMDNGVNSAILLEVARVLDQAHLQPAVDIYLVWFGSEELWLYGSQYFVNTHQELLDRTVAALLMDSIIASTSDNLLVLDGMSHSRFGDHQLAFPHYLAEKAALVNISIDEVQDYQGVASDNGVFNAFVPQAGLAFGSPQGGYAHSPYDTVERIQDLGDLMEEVASIALIAALETGGDLPDLRRTPPPDRRALIVASHTEVVHMTPATLIDFVRALAWEGFDVDVIPYGQAVTTVDLADAGLVVVLPVIDYASPDGDLGLYDEAWAAVEVESLAAYVESGGLLVLTNSANRIQFGRTFDINEDWEDANALSAPFGITFEPGVLSASSAQVRSEHPLMGARFALTLLKDNAVPFSMQTGEILAEVGGSPVVGLVDYGEAGGQVLVLADVGMLGYAGFMPPEGDNLGFYRSLASYARTR